MNKTDRLFTKENSETPHPKATYHWLERFCKKNGVEIVALCIANGKDYGLAAEKYGVSYQQVYSWVRKYEAKGTDELTYRRGKREVADRCNRI